MGEEPALDAADLRADRRGRRARGADPGRPLRQGLRQLRACQDACRADRLRRPADRDRRPARVRPRRAGDRARAQALDQRRRIPGHQPAPAAAARAVAGRPHRPVRRRRRGPDDLHVRGRDQRVPDRVRRAPPGRARDHAVAELPLESAGARARESIPRGGRTDQASRRDPAGRAAADHRALPDRGGRADRAGRLDPGADGRWGVGLGDRRAAADERPAGADRGRADPGRAPVPGPRHPVLRPARGPRRDRPRAARVGIREPDRDRAGAGQPDPQDVGREARLPGRRRDGRGRECGPSRRRGTGADRGARHADRHPRRAARRRTPGSARRPISRSSTGGARRSARARPMA